MSARAAALRVLLRLEEGRVSVQAALDRELRHAGMDARDAGLCTELVYGFLRLETRTDFILSRVLAAPRKLPREMQLVLGVAAYILFFLQRVPDYAAVDWAVGHVRRRFGAPLSRVANGALRALIRLGEAPLKEVFYEEKSCSTLQSQALFHSTPAWIAQLWANAYGAEVAMLLMRRAGRRPCPCLRLNPRNSAFSSFSTFCEEMGGLPVGQHGLAFPAGALPETFEGAALNHWHARGVFSLQSAGSQEVLNRMGPWRAPVWDACAGQGGKSLALMEQGIAVGLCSDTHTGRLEQLRRTSARLGLDCPPVVQAGVDCPPIRHWRGDVLLDVPCSGLGTLSRRPEIRRRRTPDDVRRLTDQQAVMLSRAWDCCLPGGHVVYMTCTLNPQENEAQIRRFIREHADGRVLEEWQTPHEHPWMEGMYAARLVKTR